MPRKLQRRRPNPAVRFPCLYPGCPRVLESEGGRTRHVHSAHPRYSNVPTVSVEPSSDESDSDAFAAPFDEFTAPPSPVATPSPSPPPQEPPCRFERIPHPFLNARVCDAEGKDIPLGSKPPPRTEASNDDWGSYDDDLQFHVADFLYRQDEMSQPNMNYLLHLWALSLMKYGALGPFANYQHLFDTIDATSVGDVPWKCLMVEPDRDGVPPDSLPSWKRQDYEVWYRDPDVVIKNMLDNPDFDGEFDYHPYVHLNRDGKREWCDYMSANFAWTQCDRIYCEASANPGIQAPAKIYS